MKTNFFHYAARHDITHSLSGKPPDIVGSLVTQQFLCLAVGYRRLIASSPYQPLHYGSQGILLQIFLCPSHRSIPPSTRRSDGSKRTPLVACIDTLPFPSHMRQTNANMLVLCQLESARAFDNLDAILEVKGFDGYVFGPNDLAQSMGLPGQPGHPDVVAAERQVAERIHAAGGKLHTELMAVVELRHLIVDETKRFLAENA